MATLTPSIQHLRDLIAIPSVNPMGRRDLPEEIVGEQAIAEYVAAQLSRLGMDAALVGAVNVDIAVGTNNNVYLAIVTVAASIVREQTGVVVEGWVWHPAFLWTPLGMTAIGAVAGVLPAIKAYTTDVAETLARVD